MHEQIIKNWNVTVNPDDIIYILGDISFGKVSKTVDILNQLSGVKNLIIGNHDKSLLHDKAFRDCFETIKDYLEIKVNDQHYVLSHYPFVTWNRSHYPVNYSINLFGHLHSKWKGNSRQLNVGLDCTGLTPVNELDIANILKTLPEYGGIS